MGIGTPDLSHPKRESYHYTKFPVVAIQGWQLAMIIKPQIKPRDYHSSSKRAAEQEARYIYPGGRKDSRRDEEVKRQMTRPPTRQSQAVMRGRAVCVWGVRGGS